METQQETLQRTARSRSVEKQPERNNDPELQLNDMDAGNAAGLVFEIITDIRAKTHGVSELLQNSEIAKAVEMRVATELSSLFPLIGEWDAKESSTYIHTITRIPKIKAMGEKWATERFGAYIGPRILEEAYLEQLHAMQEHLSGTSPEGQKYVESPLNFSQILLAHETFRSPQRLEELLSALDLKPFFPTNWKQETTKPTFIIHTASSNGGALAGSIEFQTYISDPEDKSKKAYLYKTYRYSSGEGEEQKATPSMSVNLDFFHLSNHTRGRGTAKEILRQSTKWYLEQANKGCPMDKFQLYAGSDVGGYAWASLGFDWDKKAEIGQKKQALQEAEASNIPSEEEIWSEAVSQLTEFYLDKCLNYLEQFSSDSNHHLLEPIQSELQELQEDLDNKRYDLITPQRLACLGKNGPFFVKSKNGKESISTDPAALGTNRVHVGKIGLLGSGWYGMVPFNPQTGAEKAQLQTYLHCLGI